MLAFNPSHFTAYFYPVDRIPLKIIFIVAFFWLTSPVSGHLIGRLVSEADEQFAAEAEIWKR